VHAHAHCTRPHADTLLVPLQGQTLLPQIRLLQCRHCRDQALHREEVGLLQGQLHLQVLQLVEPCARLGRVHRLESRQQGRLGQVAAQLRADRARAESASRQQPEGWSSDHGYVVRVLRALEEHFRHRQGVHQDDSRVGPQEE